MAIPLAVPTHQTNHNQPIMGSQSPISPANMGLYSPFSSSISMSSSQYGNSCAITILKGDAEHPIHAHAPIHQKENHAKPQSPAGNHSSRFASSFSNLRSASQATSSGFDSSVNVHAVSDQGVLLPFLDRPSEVKELLFDTKANEALMYRLCRVFGGNPQHPTQRGQDERWDEMLELLVELDRPLLDDEDWLVRLESLVMERSPELWAQLARCIGADGLTLHPVGQPSSSRFDSWALPSRYLNASDHNDSPLSAPSASSSDAEEEDGMMSVNVEPLEELPQSYSEQPAGKMQKSSLHESVSPATSPLSLAPESAAGGQASPSELFAMSASGEDSALTNSLEDIMEEPGAASLQENRSGHRRARSHSGKFAGLRISAMTSSSSPPASRRTSNASDSMGGAVRRDSSSSPLPTGAMSPAGLAQSSRDVSPTTTTSFSRHRRLSTMMMQNNTTAPHVQHEHSSSNVDAAHASGSGAASSPNTIASRRQRGVSEAGHSLRGLNLSNQSQPRRRAQSFARSFAELKSPSEHLEQLRAEHAKAEADRLAEGTNRMSLRDAHKGAGAVAASAPAVPTAGALGLHPDSSTSSTLLDPSSTATKDRRATVGAGRKRSNSKASSSTGSTSPSQPGLLPDGRTRHPSASFGSRDLSESIAAFRATMGLSISPSPSKRNFEPEEAASDAGKSTDSSSARKRKGSGGAELPKPTSRTDSAVEAKVSRKGSPPSTTNNNQEAQPATEAHYEQPKHMQELQDRNRASGVSAGGSGLALGGGFSLAKSGANFRRQSHDPSSMTSLMRSSFGGAKRGGGAQHSYRSPPSVHRRPGGFASLAQEYEKARHGRRASESGFSIHSNAVASSPSSSVASLDVAGGEVGRRRSEEDGGGVARVVKEVATPDMDGKGEPTPKAGATPSASFLSSANRLNSGYPFPNLLSRAASGSAKAKSGSDEVKAESALAPATPLSPLEARRTRLSPTASNVGGSGSGSPRSPSIVFPISPNPSFSRADTIRKALNDNLACQTAFDHLTSICGPHTAQAIKRLITQTERDEMTDEELLEKVALRIGLVDHEKAQSVGGKEAEEADVKLAEEGYEEKWEVFVELCRSLGVGEVELGEARRRCGPAIGAVCRQA